MTSVDLPIRARFHRAFWGLKDTALRIAGRLGHERGGDRLAVQHLREASAQDGRLTNDVLNSMRAQQSHAANKNLAKRLALAIRPGDLDRPLSDMPMQHKAAKLLEDALGRHRISSIANIGARVDLVSAYLAPRFPSVKFTSVDFQDDLAVSNAPLGLATNWHFVSGYALDLLGSGAIKPEGIIMTSTSVLMNNRELDEFFATLSSVKLLVLNEAWWPFPHRLDFWKVHTPEDVPEGRPVVGGRHNNYHHNYPEKLTRHGFQIEVSRIVPGSEAGACAYQVVATR